MAAAGPYALSIAAINRHRTPVSASAASMPSVSPAMISARSWPSARWRAGVKNISRYRSPWTDASTSDSYATLAQSSRVRSSSWISQKMSRNESSES